MHSYLMKSCNYSVPMLIGFPSHISCVRPRCFGWKASILFFPLHFHFSTFWKLLSFTTVLKKICKDNKHFDLKPKMDYFFNTQAHVHRSPSRLHTHTHTLTIKDLSHDDNWIYDGLLMINSVSSCEERSCHVIFRVWEEIQQWVPDGSRVNRLWRGGCCLLVCFGLSVGTSLVSHMLVRYWQHPRWFKGKALNSRAAECCVSL